MVASVSPRISAASSNVAGRLGSSKGASSQTNIETAASAKSLEPDIAQQITALKKWPVSTA
jgi:hypothetical protein